MTTTASSIVYEAQRALLDVEGVRTTASDLVLMLNRAQRDIHIARPDTTAAMSEFVLVAGAKQLLPSNAALLIDIPSNASGNLRSISKVDLPLLDALEKGWRSATQKTEIVHFCHDPRTPRVFHVYPPAVAGIGVILEASAYPIDIAAPASPGLTSDTVFGDITLADEWATTLLMLTLYYAYMTDLEGVNNPGLAVGYLQRAETMLGVQLQSSITAAKPK
jgi:hypothetical protein